MRTDDVTRLPAYDVTMTSYNVTMTSLKYLMTSELGYYKTNMIHANVGWKLMTQLMTWQANPGTI